MRRPLLYSYRRCPYAMRARMALLLADVEFDAHEIMLRDKPAAMIELSPKGTVPVLALPDGRVVDESLDIMRWAFEQHDTAGWWARAQSGHCIDLVRINDREFKHCLDRYKYPNRHEGAGDPREHRDRAVACLLHPLEARLAQHAFIESDEPCAADLAIFPFVRQFRGVDEKWFDTQPLPSVSRWLRHWVASPLFERCMTKVPTGVTVAFPLLR